MPEETPTPSQPVSPNDQEVIDYVMGWRNRLRSERVEKLVVWNECWALYRGQQDFSEREDWQTKIVLPKAWGTVKQALSVIKRFLGAAKTPWAVESTNNQDPLEALRASKLTELCRVFLDKCRFDQELSTGLETGFVMGLGVWKVNWILKPKRRLRVIQTPQLFPGSGATPPSAGIATPLSSLQQSPISFQNPQAIGQNPLDILKQQQQLYPTQLPQEALLPPNSLAGGNGYSTPTYTPTKQTIEEEVLEGELCVSAVDPYNFYWLPGSKLNAWEGTIEDTQVPRWTLIQMADRGAFPGREHLIADLGAKRIDEQQQQSYLRFGERPHQANGPTSDTGMVALTEFYGPLIINGRMIQENAHIIVANGSTLLYNDVNERWHRRPPYIGWSPLGLPFRTEGVGLVEMVRTIDIALNQITNLGVDTLIYRLMPLFELTPDVYENSEELRLGLTPGKILRRNSVASGSEMGLRPVEFNDISGGTMQMAGILDRAHQEGGLVSELQQSLPRWSGAQTATETQAIQQNQNSFFGSIATDLEKHAISPLIELVVDTIMQYLDTARDPRVAQILGVDQYILAGMSQPEVMELVAGDYEIEAKGLSDQLDKAEMLQNLIQFMNLIGQNAQAWLPYLNQDALLRRILEAFRPSIHDIEEIIADPQTAQVRQAAIEQGAQHMEMLKMLPQLAALSHQISRDQQAAAQAADAHEAKVADQAIALQSAQQPQSEDTND